MEEQKLHPTVFDTEDQQVATLYGKALIGAAGKNVDLIVDQLEAVVRDCLDRHPKLEMALASPQINEEDKEAMLSRIFNGKIDKVLLNFLKVMARRRRLNALRAVHAAVSVMRDEALGRLRVKVSSAQPLTDAQKKSISAQLQQTFGKEHIVLIEKVDPALLGGIVLRIGDRVYDGSVQGKLQNLRRAVSSGVEKAIRDQYASLLS